MTYQALPKELHVKDSPIAGQGIFAKEDIDAMMYIGVSHIIVDDIISVSYTHLTLPTTVRV